MSTGSLSAESRVDAVAVAALAATRLSSAAMRLSSSGAVMLLELEPPAPGTVAALLKGATRFTSSKNSAAPLNPPMGGGPAPAAWYADNSVVRSRSVSSNDSENAINLRTEIESTAFHGRNWVISSAAYSGGKG